MSISLLLNLTAKYNLIRSSTAGITHGKQRRLGCDEFDPTLQSKVMWFLDKKNKTVFSQKFATLISENGVYI